MLRTYAFTLSTGNAVTCPAALFRQAAIKHMGTCILAIKPQGVYSPEYIRNGDVSWASVAAIPAGGTLYCRIFCKGIPGLLNNFLLFFCKVFKIRKGF